MLIWIPFIVNRGTLKGGLTLETWGEMALLDYKGCVHAALDIGTPNRQFQRS
jgi:hypothetical protein